MHEAAAQHSVTRIPSPRPPKQWSRPLTDSAFARARDVIARNRDALERAASCLLEKETLDELQLRALFEGIQASTPASAKLQAAS